MHTKRVGLSFNMIAKGKTFTTKCKNYIKFKKNAIAITQK